MQKIVPRLRHVNEAEEAARFYASVFSVSRVDRVTALLAGSPSEPAGSVSVVEFKLRARSLTAIRASPHHRFNDAVSLLETAARGGRSIAGTPCCRTAASPGLLLDHRQVGRAVAGRSEHARADDYGPGQDQGQACGGGF